MPETPGDLTHILRSIDDGAEDAADRLFDVVYDELHAIAERQLASEAHGRTLGATDLLHEAYLSLVGDDQLTFENRAHFFGAAARAMYRIVVDHARRRSSQKRGGLSRRVPLHESLRFVELTSDPLELDDLLTRFARRDPRATEAVKHFYFLGLGVNQIAQILSVSPRTVKSDLRAARAWIKAELSRNDSALMPAEE